MLDVGGGNNPFVKLLLPYTQDLTISDFSISDEAQEVCAGNIFDGNFEDSSIPENTFDVIWSSSSDIELTEFNKVYDKYGELLTKDIKITNSPIYAFHK